MKKYIVVAPGLSKPGGLSAVLFEVEDLLNLERAVRTKYPTVPVFFWCSQEDPNESGFIDK